MGPKTQAQAQGSPSPARRSTSRQASPKQSVITTDNMELLWLYHLASGAHILTLLRKPNHQVIATHFGIPYKTVASRYTRIREQFKHVELTEAAQRHMSTSARVSASKYKVTKQRAPPKSKAKVTDEDDEDKPAPTKKSPGHSLSFDGDDFHGDDEHIPIHDDREYRY
ncbi:hypothetical protein N7468_002710 [Penicillium chermesinum]|uniref:Uncharacterized protein n=1 Tax=Penicillium chermesinum TaxID=63820 RepID=A0A9W9PKG7_9EURO|nr:uncharacterized protein N7468_002710 [Penicillium chermesinum]KAJ5247727.1 hypothetical protein N7468_002710 [Penicillium chermesinum]KAJ6151493.1 hypothetical protein N7470_007090 [Penicillium chermesinum]